MSDAANIFFVMMIDSNVNRIVVANTDVGLMLIRANQSGIFSKPCFDKGVNHFLGYRFLSDLQANIAAAFNRASYNGCGCAGDEVVTLTD